MSAFEDFIQVELPRRPWTSTDPDQETIPVRRGAGPRQLDFVSMTDGQVLGKVGGIVQGVDVSALTGSISHVHTQSTGLDAWFIEHNKDSEDYILFVFDDLGNQVIPDNVSAFDSNIIEVDFGASMTGKAVIIFA